MVIPPADGDLEIDAAPLVQEARSIYELCSPRQRYVCLAAVSLAASIQS